MATSMTAVISNCGGQPEDDLDPESIFDPSFTVNSPTATEGSSLQFNFELEFSKPVAIFIDYSSASGSATSGSDFPEFSGTLTVAAGETSVTIEVPTSQDSIDENDETLNLVFSNPLGISLTEASFPGTITDDDAPPNLSALDVSAIESGTAIVTVSLAALSEKDVSFNFTAVNGAAIAPSDYQPSSGSGDIYAGQRTTQIAIPLSDDLIPEANEVFQVNFNSVVNALPTAFSANVTITDDDAGNNPYTHLSPVTSAEGLDLVFEVTFEFANTIPMNFDVTAIDGSATSPTDYSFSPQTFVVPPGTLIYNITVTGNDDLLFEQNEVFSLSLSNFVNLNAGDVTVIGMITDDEVPPDLSVYDVSLSENTNALVLVSLTHPSTQDVTFSYITSSGSAVAGADFVAESGSATIPPLTQAYTLTITIDDDQSDEPEESFSLNLSSVSGANGVDTAAAVFITDNDLPPTLFIENTAASEGDTLEFLVSLSSQSGFEISFQLDTLDGTAFATSDYETTNEVLTIPAGVASIGAFVSTSDDLILESTEEFYVSLSALISVNAGDDFAVATITDNDLPPDIQVLDNLGMEGDAILVLVTLSSVSDLDVTFDYTTVDADALSISDYTPNSGAVTIPPGSQLYSFLVQTTEDAVIESQELFLVSLSNVSGANLISGAASIGIQDDDNLPDIITSDMSGNEGNVLEFIVSLSTAGVSAISFDYVTFDGSATQIGDYVSTSGSATFAIGQLEVTIPVTTVDNLIDEADRSFLLSLSNVVNADDFDLEGTGLVLDDEPSPSLFVTNGVVTEGDTAFFTVSLSEITLQDVEFVLNTVDTGSATSATDFAVAATAATIFSGSLNITLSSVTMEDSIYETNETYLVSLGNVANGTPGKITGLITITNDDLAPTLEIFGISVDEGASSQLLVSLTGATEVDAVFSFESLDGTASSGVDYVDIPSTQATIAVGSTTTSIFVQAIEDAVIEGDLSFEVSISPVADVSIASAAATVTIFENDNIPDIYILDTTLTEGQTAEVVISLSTPGLTAITFDYATFDQSADSPSDFASASGSETIASGQETFTLSVVTVEDTDEEPLEDFSISLSAVVGAVVIDDQALVNITDNDTTIYIDDLALTEGETFSFVISLSKIVPQDVEFFLSTSDGTALDVSDYTPTSGWFTISAGSLSVTTSILSTQDLVDEYDEYFDINLASLSGASAGDIVASANILDDDVQPAIFVSNVSVNEGETISFNVSLSEASEKEISFAYDTFDIGSAAEGTDFTSASMNITLAAGTTQANLLVASIEDLFDEVNETFDVSLSSLVDVDPGDIQGIATIVDDDLAPSIFVDDLEIAEGDTALISVTLSSLSGQNIIFAWSTADGTATAGIDYTAFGATVTLLAGQAGATLSVSSLDDGIAEGDLTFDINLGGLVSVTAGDLVATITIDDDEGPPDAPLAISLVSPMSLPSNDDTPDIEVGGVLPGFSVRLYTDEACSSPVAGSAIVGSGSSVTITANPALSEGSVTIFATQEDLTPIESACSTVSLVYDLDLTPPLAALSLSLPSAYAPDPTNSPLFSWVPSASVDAALHDVALGTSPGGEEIASFSVPDTGTTHTYGSLTLTECSAGLPVYYPSVRVTDTAGNTTIATHPVGFRYDNSNPGVPGLPVAAGDAATDRASSVSWTAGSDNCAVASYEIAIGTAPEGTDKLDWKDIGNNLSYQAVDGVDGVNITISNGVFYYTSVRTKDETGRISGARVSPAWRFTTPPEPVNDLGFAGRTSSSVDLSWTAPADNGATITDYTIEYKNSTIATWTTFSDGISSDTTATVDGLDPSTTYDFRVKAFNGGLSAASNILTQETAPDDPFFDPTLYSAMNLGGATDSAIVAFDDNTILILNGTTTLSPIDAGQVTVISGGIGDVITSEKPFFVAGRLRNGGSDNQKGNIVWNTPSWSGKEFLAVGSRDQEHVITVYAFEEAVITIAAGVTTYVDGVTVAAGTSDTYRLPVNAGYTIESTSDIVAYQYSEGGSNNNVTDNLPILPPSTDIIGIPSRTGQYTTNATSTSFNWYESDGTSDADNVNFGVFQPFGGNGAQYSGPAARVIANDPVIGRSNADSDGYDSSPFVPRSFQRQRYAINHLAEWFAFASDKPAVLQVFEPGHSQSSITLTNSGSHSNEPYFARLTNVAQGTIVESNTRFAAWYESDEAAEASSSREDETVLFGYDGVGLPVHHKLHMWLDASDPTTLFQQDDCTSVVSSNGESVGCWLDKSLQGHNASQPGTKPTWVESVAGFGGQPGIDFNGGGQFFTFDQSFLNNTNYTIFAVVHRDGTASNQLFLGTQSAVVNQGLHLGYSSNTSAVLGQYTNELTTSVSDQSENSLGLFVGRLNSSGKTLIYNGQSTTDLDGTQLSSTGQGVIGRGFDTGGLDGQVAEIIIFARDLSDDEIILMQDYLKEKWLRPTNLADIRLWLDASDPSTLYTNTACTTPVTGTGQSIGCWKDKSGNGYDAISSAGSIQYTSDVGKNVIQFTNGSLTITGETSGAVFSNNSTLDAAEVFAFMKSSSATENGFLFHHPAGGGFKAQVPNNGNVQFDLDAGGAGTISTAWGANTSTYYRWNFYSENTTGSQGIYRDDLSLATDASASSMTIGTEMFTIGAQSGNTNFQNMNLGSILIFNRKLLPDERHMIRAYLDTQ